MLNEISYETAKAFLEERRGDETLNTTDDDVAGHLINSDNYHHRERKGEYKRELRELFDLVLEARAKPVGGKTLALACKAKDPQECQYALKRLFLSINLFFFISSLFVSLFIYISSYLFFSFSCSLLQAYFA